MKFQITNRFNLSVLFECEAASLKLAVELAVEKSINLSGAYLSGADLSGAYLRGADLRGAYLSGADLSGADLRDAYLSGADLRGAYLRGAYLSGADLSGAYLSDAKEDFLKKINLQKAEVPELYKSLVDGKINGSCYEGACCCFAGTIAKAKGVKYTDLSFKADSSSPTEKLFLAIREGDTPLNNPIANIVVGWIKEWAVAEVVRLPERRIFWSDIQGREVKE